MAWLEMWVRVVKSFKMIEDGAVSQNIYNLVSTCHCKYNSILYDFRVIWRWIISWRWTTIKGHSRSLKIAPFYRSCTSFLITMVLSCIISEIKRDISRLSFDALIRGLRRNIAVTFGTENYTVFQKNVTTFSMISWSRTIRLQIFLAHLLPRV